LRRWNKKIWKPLEKGVSLMRESRTGKVFDQGGVHWNLPKKGVIEESNRESP